MKMMALSMAAALLAGIGCSAEEEKTSRSTESKKILVVYFSRSNNTRTIAEYIQKNAGGEIFEIVPVKPYPKDYYETTEQAKKEINEGFRPELKTKVKDITKYDTIFVGSPNWWSTVAPPVSTFLGSYDLSGKTLVPFMTHEGSGLGIGVEEIKKLAPKSTVLDGLAIRGSRAKRSEQDVIQWLEKMNLKKKDK